MEHSLTFAALADSCRADPPRVALVLGSGLGPLVARLRVEQTVPFAAVPGLPPSSVQGHRGRLLLGSWAGRRLLLFEGRLHYYEGHPWEVVVRPILLAGELGVRVVLLTNAAGGIRADLGPGSLLAIRDHLEWTCPYWWREPGPGGLGPARPAPYAVRLLDVLKRAAEEARIELGEGVYAAVTGPCYETAAEIRALRAWGADAVGMSTAREVQAGADAGLECAAISFITNRAAGLSEAPLSHEEVLAAAAAGGDRLADLVERALRLLDD
jgi:purine-nucleoside phosphorylase